jgi:small subunit ribosomal protein S4
MNKVKELHRKAMGALDQALLLKQKGDNTAYEQATRLALRLESEAADLLRTELDAEPARSILYRSAASIAIELHLPKSAERLIKLALAGHPPIDIASDLKTLLGKVQPNPQVVPKPRCRVTITGSYGFVDVSVTEKPIPLTVEDELSHGRGSYWGIQFHEKQKVKQIYGIVEGQLRGYLSTARAQPDQHGSALLALLEQRIDNVVYRLGLARSRSKARMWVSQGCILVNGRRVDVARFQVQPGDKITVEPRLSDKVSGRVAARAAKARSVPGWLKLDSGSLTAHVIREPGRADFVGTVSEELIIQLESN